MKRYELIQHLIDTYGYKSYLEIGVSSNVTFSSIDIEIKDSVDPNGNAIYNVPSDEFFETLCERKYDIIFIDGLHLAEQVVRDIENSLTVLNEHGVIVVHDCLPDTEQTQFREPVSGQPWTGDVWKAFARLRGSREDLEMYVVDTDCGCGIIRSGKQYLFPVMTSPLTWEYFCKTRNDLMNVVSVDRFKEYEVGHE